MALATPAYAAEESAPSADDQIVVTATRTPLEIADAPASVTVIDDEQIADQLVTDIKDLVRYEPGVSVRRAPASVPHSAPPAALATRISSFAALAATAC